MGRKRKAAPDLEVDLSGIDLGPVEDRAPAGSKKGRAKSSNGSDQLGIEAQLFLAADKLRKNLEPSDYKHVALGLIFLKHISIAFEAKRASLLADDSKAAEDPDEYLAENVFWVPKEVLPSKPRTVRRMVRHHLQHPPRRRSDPASERDHVP